MTEYACPRRELSCIVGNLFVELEPPCDHCAAGDSLTICGTTYAGTRATLTVTEYGFTFDGPPEEVEQIRERRCLKYTSDKPNKNPHKNLQSSRKRKI